MRDSTHETHNITSSQCTHDVVFNVFIRRLYDVGDVVCTSYRRWKRRRVCIGKTLCSLIIEYWYVQVGSIWTSLVCEVLVLYRFGRQSKRNLVKLLPNLYANKFAAIQSYRNQSQALNKSVSNAISNIPSSMLLRYLSCGANRQYCTLWPFRDPSWNFEKMLLKELMRRIKRIKPLVGSVTGRCSVIKILWNINRKTPVSEFPLVKLLTVKSTQEDDS